MRAGWYRRGPLKIKQYMVFQTGPLAGKAKGLKAVCIERFGLDAVIGEWTLFPIQYIEKDSASSTPEEVSDGFFFSWFRSLYFIIQGIHRLEPRQTLRFLI